MSDTEKTTAANSTDGVDVGASGPSALAALKHADDVMLAKLGYKSEFRREFSVSRFVLCRSRHCHEAR